MDLYVYFVNNSMICSYINKLQRNKQFDIDHVI